MNSASELDFFLANPNFNSKLKLELAESNARAELELNCHNLNWSRNCVLRNCLP